MKAVIKYLTFFILLFFYINTSYAQVETSKWKALIAVGLNSPEQAGFVTPFQGKGTNFPTINLGIQHMFKARFGAKLDFGYNRILNEDNTPEFKVNYTRINAQLVYDTTSSISFLPINMGFVLHAGPGYSMIKPLNIYGENKNSYFNVMGGIELHYGVSRTVSVFVDGSYIYGFGKAFDPITDGAGSFNGNLFTTTIGVSVSLSGCTFCN